MEIFILIISITLNLILIAYLVILFQINDFNLPELNLEQYRQPGKKLVILAAFPHPDDETVPTGGTLAKYAHAPNTEVIIVCATRGEAGETNGVCQFNELAAIREQELKAAAQQLGVKQVIFLEQHDGKLQQEISGLRRGLIAVFDQHHPDVILTYDSSGLYGHPDHIVMSAVIRELVLTKFTTTKVFFVTLPQKILRRIKLPQTITTADKVLKLEHSGLMRGLPDFKSSFWRLRNHKLAAIRAHRTQNLRKMFKPLPLWLVPYVGWVEYFTEAKY